MTARHEIPRRRPSLTAPGGVAILLLAVVVVGVYLGSLDGAFVFDDIPAILDNPTIRHPGDVAGLLAPPGDEAGTVGGRPVLNLTLALNYAFGGVRPRGYHAVNLAIHVASTLLLFGLIRRTLDRIVGGCAIAGVSGPSTAREIRKGSRTQSESLLIAFFASLLWAVHPLQTEAVTYVVQRAESLMGLFYLLTLYGFVRYAGPEAVGIGSTSATPLPSNAGRRCWAALALLACLLGMATKEVMVSAPLVVLLYDRTFVAGSFRRAWRCRSGLYLGMAATWVVLAVLVAGTHGRGGSAGFGAPAGVWPYALTQGKAIVHYLRLAFWPDRLVFDYGTALVRDPGEVLPQCLLLLALVAGAVWALGRRPGAGFAACCFFAVLAPSSSLVPIATEPMAEHRMYLPLAAVSVLAVAAIQFGLSRLAPRAARIGLCALGMAAAVGLGAATVRRNRDYRSEIALWTDTVAKVPSNPRAHNNLGQAFLAAGDPGRAVEAFTAAAGVDPAYAPAQYNLGAMLLDARRPAEAIPHLERALSAPRHQAELRRYLGEAYERTGAYASAAAQYREALRLAPGSVEAAFGLGYNLAAQGRYAEAVNALRLAADGAPERVQIRNNLANALLFSGRTREAIAEYREALKRDPDNAAIRENLERALVRKQGPDAP